MTEQTESVADAPTPVSEQSEAAPSDATAVADTDSSTESAPLPAATQDEAPAAVPQHEAAAQTATAGNHQEIADQNSTQGYRYDPKLGYPVRVYGVEADPKKSVMGFVADVLEDGSINVGGFRANGQHFHETRIQFIQPDEPKPETGSFATVPYYR